MAKTSFYDNNHPLFFQNPGFKNNDTYLHIAVRNFKNMVDFESELKDLDEEILSTMALINNDNGELPYDLIQGFGIESNKLRQKLLTLMRKHLNTKLHDPIKVDPVEPLNLKLRYNMYVAEIIANKVRAIIDESSTHPQLNSYNSVKQPQIITSIIKLRHEIDCRPKIPEKVANIAYYVKQDKVGNCQEYSYLALFYLSIIDPSLLGEVMYTENGDHVFLVLDRKKNSDLNNSSTWGSSAVICDAWSGNIYPASSTPWRLQCYKKYFLPGSALKFNVLGSYNPRFHTWVKEYSSQPTAPKLNQEQMLSKLIKHHKLSKKEAKAIKAKRFKI